MGKQQFIISARWKATEGPYPVGTLIYVSKGGGFTKVLESSYVFTKQADATFMALHLENWCKSISAPIAHNKYSIS